jgi:alpha-beta hydrolase superfamily lysophospholipase
MKAKFKNQNGLEIVAYIDKVANPKGLVFITHGLGGTRLQTHIKTLAESFKERQFTVISYDSTNSIGESDGRYEDATITSYYDDLQSAVNWASTQKWYIEPFYLVGHSLGGISSAYYAKNNPNKVKAIALISSVISGELSSKTDKYKDVLENWKKTGWLIRDNKKLPWSHMEDRYSYNLIKDSKFLNMPVLIVVGENDNATPFEHQKLLFQALPGPKEIHIIKGAPHTFKEVEHLGELKSIVQSWIENT